MRSTPLPRAKPTPVAAKLSQTMVGVVNVYVPRLAIVMDAVSLPMQYPWAKLTRLDVSPTAVIVKSEGPNATPASVPLPRPKNVDVMVDD